MPAGVSTIEVRYLADLPLSSTLTLRIPGLDGVLVLTTSRARAQTAVACGELCLTPLEYELLAVALADGRCTREDARRELAHKAEAARKGRAHRLTRERLLGPVRGPSKTGERWTIGRLLEALGAEVGKLEVHE